MRVAGPVPDEVLEVKALWVQRWDEEKAFVIIARAMTGRVYALKFSTANQRIAAGMKALYDALHGRPRRRHVEMH
jgi:hypothetical protein